MNLLFEADFTQPIMLILEPFESSWARVHKLSCQLIQALSGQIEGLYFLGSAKRYSVSLPMEFVDKTPSWFREHKDRVSLLNPILEEKESRGFPGMGLVVCSKLPVDFEDWLDHELLSRMIFVNVGEEPFDLEENEMDFRAGIEPILEALKNPPVELAVDGQGFFPLCYKETEGNSFEASASQGRVSIRASSPRQRCSLHLKALSPSEPKLMVTRTRGNTELIEGRQCATRLHER